MCKPNIAKSLLFILSTALRIFFDHSYCTHYCTLMRCMNDASNGLLVHCGNTQIIYKHVKVTIIIIKSNYCEQIKPVVISLATCWYKNKQLNCVSRVSSQYGGTAVHNIIVVVSKDKI